MGTRIVMFIALFLIIVGCSKKEQVVEKTEEDVTENGETTVVTEEESPYYYPLTGLGSEEEVTGRAVAVMVNNHPSARPQSGLYEADLVYEVLAEGNITRFLAIFQSKQPEIIGPVRSARNYYIELAEGYDSLYIAHGNSPDAQKMLESGNIDNLNGLYYDGTLFERVSFRKAPHNSYITFKNILKGAEQNKYDTDSAPELLTFLTKDEVKKITGDAANTVTIAYYDETFSSSFEYDSASGRYTRYSNGEKMVDYDTNQPVQVDNIFIVEAVHKIVDDYGKRDIDLTSGGSGYLIQKGKKMDVEWKNVNGRILPYKNGVAIGFLPGQTWVNMIPTTPGLTKAITF